MSSSISLHVSRNEKFDTDFKMTWSKYNGAYPVLTIKSDEDEVVVFPSFKQVRQMQAALENLVVEMEKFEVEEKEAE